MNNERIILYYIKLLIKFRLMNSITSDLFLTCRTDAYIFHREHRSLLRKRTPRQLAFFAKLHKL